MSVAQTQVHNSQLPFSAEWMARLAALVAAIIGLWVMVGWKLHPDWKDSTTVFMNPLTAMNFLMCAIALWLVSGARTQLRPLVVAIAFIQILLGLMVCLSWVMGKDFTFDDWLFQNLYGIPDLIVNNIAVPTALAFVFLGLALTIMDVRRDEKRWPAEILVFLVFLLSLFSILSYLFGITGLTFLGWKAQMALSTANTFVLLCFGFWCARADWSIVHLMRQRTAGGAVVRQLIPAAILVPVVLSWLRYQGIYYNIFGRDFGISLFTVSIIAVFTLMVYYLGWTLHRSDLQQRESSQKLQDSELRYRVLTESAHDAIITIDPKGTILSWNRFAAELYGYTEEEVIGKPGSILSPPEVLEQQQRQQQEQPPQEAPEVALTAETVGLKKDGTRFPIEYSIAHWDIPEGRFYTAIVRDITERKKAEEQLRELNASLNERALELNKDLVRKTQEMEFINRELEAFAFSVSHDLRAPLRSLNGFSQALLEDYSDQLDETGQDYLDRIKKNSDRMAHLIDDILHLSRISRTEMRHQKVNLTALAESVLEDLRFADPERKVEVEIQPGLAAVGDPTLLRVVLQNLLGNAWKFTSRTEQARIQFGQMQDDQQDVYFVADNGAGFDMQNMDRLFGVFQRLHKNSEFEGTGVGLASVQRVIHRHGGRVWAHGEVGKGATFFFTLGHFNEDTGEQA
ncbi:PAS domain S-box protein [Deinococcus cellulosilyticus]|uniref:histidine kinase n=1 Tax=Deinococcus cellulosilyticus (strain DSM 18568 / NBRC 106333 / KACC 11606 / 5516J-15) TaxID=1223518 RepID=A0A511MXJ7_DEIC1|nr:PAS domain S-box protein [Deinococcus cellulosilyticus]GEM44856.1 hypothetical protein DC3_04910 [Deinococcus cellulosilyticus NBRC 106333 = KACC 11606]